MKPTKTIRIYTIFQKGHDLDSLYNEMERRFAQSFMIESTLEKTDGRSARIALRKFENLYNVTVYPYHQVQINNDSLHDPEYEQKDIEEIQKILSEVFEQ